MNKVLALIPIGCLTAFFFWPRILFFSVAGFGMNAYTIAAPLILIFSIVNVLASRRAQQGVAVSIASAPGIYILFTVYWCFRVLAEVARGTGSSGIVTMLINFMYYGSWFVSCSLLFQAWTMRRWLYILAGLAVPISVFVTCIELVTQKTFLSFTGLASFALGDPSLLQSLISVKARDGIQRVQSLYENPVIYPQIISGLAILIIAPVSRVISATSKSPRLIVRSATIVAMGFALFSTTSRSPFVVLTLGLVISSSILFFNPKKWYAYALLVTGICAIFVTGNLLRTYSETLIGGRTTSEISSNNSRSLQIDMGLMAIDRSPVFGHGPGSAPILAGLELEHNVRTIDNDYLAMAIEAGWTGLGLFIAFLFIAFFGAMAAALSWKSYPAQRAEAAALAGSIVVMAVSLTVVTSGTIESYIYILAAAVTGLRTNIRQNPVSDNLVPSSPI